MKKTTLVAGLLLFVIPFVSLAQDEDDDEFTHGELEPSVWYLDTEVIVNGSYLNGPAPSQSKVCFAPEVNQNDLRCFKYGHPNISKWTYSNITFIPPKNAPPAGVVIIVQPEYEEECHVLYGDYNCVEKLVKNKVNVGNYKAQPHIASIVDVETGELATYLHEGKEYEIAGYRFGDTGLGLYINDRLVDKSMIKRWTHDSILFEGPENYDGAENLRVHNGAGKGNMWEFEDSVLTVNSEVTTKTRGTLLVRDTVNASSVRAQLSEQQLEEEEESEEEESSEESEEGEESEETGESTEAIYEDFFRANEEEWFSDVDLDDPYYAAMAWALYYGYATGYEDGSFRPDQPVNRAEFLKILLEADPEVEIDHNTGLDNSFRDITGFEWFSPYVEYAEKNGVVEGYDDGMFHADRDVNFAEALKIAYSHFDIYTDRTLNTTWYERYAAHAEENEVLFSADVSYDEGMTRRDVIWVIWKLLELRG